ncbi:MAG: tRNA lysidine(34) synthetase TilS [Sulfurimonas sp.]
MQLSLELDVLELLKNRRNLLAFSGGVDSSALFFLLVEAGVEFDIAIVDYALRKQSKDELSYAKDLAKNYKKLLYTYEAPKFTQNFEAKAREIRYSFFEKLIDEHGYENLLTAHHLGDRLEWFFMQLSKGAGLLELLGMQLVEQKTDYKLIRPLLGVAKSELLEYLHTIEKNYFIDETNTDEKYKRNYFRHNFSEPLLKEFLGGIKRSFSYLDSDKNILLDKNLEVENIGDFAYVRCSSFSREAVFAVDKYLKTKGYMLSFSEKQSLKSTKTLQVGRRFILTLYVDKFIFIAPYVEQKVVLDKVFKEECRVLKIDPAIRGFLYLNRGVFLSLKELLSKDIRSSK